MENLHFTLSGLTCQGCVRALTRAIHKSDPQADVQIDLEQLRLDVRTVLNASEVQARIEAAGFSGAPLAG